MGTQRNKISTGSVTKFRTVADPREGNFPELPKSAQKTDGPAHEPPAPKMMNQQHPGGKILHPAGENDKTKGRDLK